MKNQVDNLRARGISSAVFNSTLTMGERDTILDDLSQSGPCTLRVLFTTPESLFAQNPVLTFALKKLHSRGGICLIGVDEVIFLICTVFGTYLLF